MPHPDALAETIPTSDETRERLPMSPTASFSPLDNPSLDEEGWREARWHCSVIDSDVPPELVASGNSVE